MSTISVAPHPAPDWDAYVRLQPGASCYLLSGWTLLAREVFGHAVWFVEARDARGALTGVLPLVHQKSLLGNFATSVAFFNYGGALADDEIVAQALMQQARAVAQAAGCAYLEFRDAQQHAGDWAVRTDKVSMVLEMPADAQGLSKQLGAKLRSQVKRADRENPTVRTGGAELLADFYDIFCRTMRDLGTPVYPKRFFQAILAKFPGDCAIVVIDKAGQPAAAGFLVICNGRAEIPWAGCRNDAKPGGFNMKLYWEVLMFAVARGCRQFDFGRSTLDSGTYRFKKQWGAEPLQLYWHRWERKARQGHPQQRNSKQGEATAQPASEGRLMRYATAVWQRLPLGVANALGPFVSPHLPW